MTMARLPPAPQPVSATADTAVHRSRHQVLITEYSTCCNRGTRHSVFLRIRRDGIWRYQDFTLHSHIAGLLLFLPQISPKVLRGAYDSNTGRSCVRPPSASWASVWEQLGLACPDCTNHNQVGLVGEMIGLVGEMVGLVGLVGLVGVNL